MKQEGCRLLAQVRVWNVRTSEFEAVAVRDTANISAIAVVNAHLFVGATNGSIREWSLPHNVKNIEYRASMWEHNARINMITYGGIADPAQVGRSVTEMNRSMIRNAIPSFKRTMCCSDPGRAAAVLRIGRSFSARVGCADAQLCQDAHTAEPKMRDDEVARVH